MKALNFFPLFRKIFQIAWPVLVSQFALTGYGVIDTVMAGRLGAVELAGVGIGAVITLTIMVTCSGVLLALTPLVAHLHGAGKPEEIGEEVRQSLWVAFGVTAVAMTRASSISRSMRSRVCPTSRCCNAARRSGAIRPGICTSHDGAYRSRISTTK